MGNKWLDDSFEKITDSVSSTAQKAVQEFVSVGSGRKQTSSQDKTMQNLEKGQSSGQNFTKLDPARLKKLEEGYKNQDGSQLTQERQQLEQLKRHYFTRFRQEEKRAIMALKQEEIMRKQREEEEKERKKREEEAKKTEAVAMPKGKVRRSIFSFKRQRKASMAETRAGSGKQ